jgi:2-polyprenyl-3-methyl-5-hydroxy-6-metoxy-1,4-benzoquinol methylase
MAEARAGSEAQPSVSGSHDQLDPYYCQPRRELLEYVAPSVKRLLDVGCGAGAFGASLKERGVPEVVGIELKEEAARGAAQRIDRVLVGDVEEMDLSFEEGYFDCIVFADLLEHLYDPTTVLRRMARVLSPGGYMLMSIPNARFHFVFSMLASGRWKYEDAGILDRTHIRFFTAVEMRNMVRAADLQVLQMLPLSMQTPEMLPRAPDGSVMLHENLKYAPRNDKDYLDLLTAQYVVLAGHAPSKRQAETL